MLECDFVFSEFTLAYENIDFKLNSEITGKMNDEIIEIKNSMLNQEENTILFIYLFI